VDDVLAAVARGLSDTDLPETGEEEQEAEDDSSGPSPTVTRATAELFARLRREVGGAEQDDSDEKAA
jgi:hypothetical protein